MVICVMYRPAQQSKVSQELEFLCMKDIESTNDSFHRNNFSESVICIMAEIVMILEYDYEDWKSKF